MCGGISSLQLFLQNFCLVFINQSADLTAINDGALVQRNKVFLPFYYDSLTLHLSLYTVVQRIEAVRGRHRLFSQVIVC